MYLAEAAVNAFGHVNIVTGGPPGAIGTLLGLDGDSLKLLLQIEYTGYYNTNFTTFMLTDIAIITWAVTNRMFYIKTKF